MDEVQITSLLFQNRITPGQLPLFRGAMIQHFGDNLLFHNHVSEAFRYAYPLIQYKRINGCAAMVGVNEGADALRKISLSDTLSCILGKEPYEFKPKCMNTELFFVHITDKLACYRLSDWLPLNQENYQKYQRLSQLSARIEMLEKVLVGNILSFAKGVGIHISSTIVCKLMDIEALRLLPYKGVELMGFHVSFQSNILLPDYIGIGKGASINHGVITSL